MRLQEQGGARPLVNMKGQPNGPTLTRFDTAHYNAPVSNGGCRLHDEQEGPD